MPALGPYQAARKLQQNFARLRCIPPFDVQGLVIALSHKILDLRPESAGNEIRIEDNSHEKTEEEVSANRRFVRDGEPATTLRPILGMIIFPDPNLILRLGVP